MALDTRREMRSAGRGRLRKGEGDAIKTEVTKKAAAIDRRAAGGSEGRLFDANLFHRCSIRGDLASVYSSTSSNIALLTLDGVLTRIRL